MNPAYLEREKKNFLQSFVNLFLIVAISWPCVRLGGSLRNDRSALEKMAFFLSCSQLASLLIDLYIEVGWEVSM